MTHTRSDLSELFYPVHRSPLGASPPPPDDPAWSEAATLKIHRFHAKSSEHRPVTRVRLLHDNHSLAVLFTVEDRYVLCRHTQPNDMVCLDSCVEFFTQPRPEAPPSQGGGYFNFEVNCGGTLHLSYVQPKQGDDWASGKQMTMVPPEQSRAVQIHASLPPTVEPELTEPTGWWVAMLIPLSLLEPHTGHLGELSGQAWRANFYKCADQSSHPHWAMWAPIDGPLGFHRPDRFAPLKFG